MIKRLPIQTMNIPLISLDSVRNIIKTIFEFLVILLIWLLFEDFWISAFDKYFLPYLSRIRMSLFSDMIFALILLFVIGFTYKCFLKKYYIPISGILYSFLIIGIYCKYRIGGEYIPIPSPLLKLGYTDILIVLYGVNVIIWLVAYIPQTSSRDTKECKNLIPDFPIKNIESDVLDYAPVAKNLAFDLEHIDFDGTCSIGLIAPWGFGKTSFLNLLCLQLSNEKFIVIKFNPRHSSDPYNIQKNFFDLLYSTLQEYDSRFSSSFKEYLKAIDIIGRNNVFSKIYNTHKIWNKESEKEKINAALNRIGKKVIIVIEDFDRLLSNEIIEIFKLLDGNASFSNIIFITAYDKHHINTLIGNTYSNERSSFSDKFFTIEIQLPLRPYNKILNYLIANLCERLNATNEEKKEYLRILNSNINILSKYLITLRDVKRFLNLFIRQYLQIKDEVEFRDFFLLYLIKFRYPDEYDNLYRCFYIKSNVIIGKGRYVLKNDNVEAQSKDVLQILFDEQSKASYRSINNEQAFDIYFYESVYDGLEIKSMRKLLNLPSMDSVQKYINSLSDNEMDALINYLYTFNVLSFANVELFERYVDILIYINCRIGQGYRLLLGVIFKSTVKNIIDKYYDKDESVYKSVITKRLHGQYPNYPISMINDLIVAIINKEYDNDILFNHREILEVAKYALRDLLRNDDIVNNRHLWMLYNCIESIDPNTRITTLDKDMCREICNCIKRSPNKYLESFVRLGSASLNPEYNNIACEPFYDQIFGCADNFENYIGTLNFLDVPTVIRVQNFWALYKNNEYKPLAFSGQGNVKDKIDNDLKSEVQQLNRLLSIRSEFEQYESDRIKIIERSDNSWYLNQYNRMLQDINNIHLNIKLKDNMLSNVQSIISQL